MAWVETAREARRRGMVIVVFILFGDGVLLLGNSAV